MGSHAGNSSSVKGAREQSVLGQGSGRANKSTAATDFLPLSCYSGIYCRAAEKQLLLFSTPWSPLIQIECNACSRSGKYLDQKVPTRENRCRQVNIFAIKINFTEILPEKGKFSYEGKRKVIKCFD